MNTLNINDIRDYHAHVYYTNSSKSEAAILRRQMSSKFRVVLGKWYDCPVGPHPQAMYQVTFEYNDFENLIAWLTKNRMGLSILIHPNTGDDLGDHKYHSLWIGDKLDLDFKKLGELPQ